MLNLGTFRALSVQLRGWFDHHRSEFIIGAVLAVVCAIAFGYPIALAIAPPIPPHFKIYVVAEADDNTAKQFEASKATRGLHVGDVPVDLQIIHVQEKEDTEETAVATAKRLIENNDALLVVGHFASQATEASLPVYLGARPQIPFIATVQTDDDLLKRCKPSSEETPGCFDRTRAVPLLQLSPTNVQQAKWAVEFAVSKGKMRFLIVTDNDPRNQSYVQSLGNAYRDQINLLSRPNHRLAIVNPLIADYSPLSLRRQDPDCVLYAGSMDAAGSLLKSLRESAVRAMVVLSDSAVSRNGLITDDEVSGIAQVNFTDQIHADDYRERKDVYGLDGIAIASLLVNDLNERGLDWMFRLKSRFGMQTAADARRQLVRIMGENSKYRTSYLGAPETATAEGPTVYAFVGPHRLGGIFHVWQRSRHPPGNAGQLDDIDGWHPPREEFLSSADAPAVTANR